MDKKPDRSAKPKSQSNNVSSAAKATAREKHRKIANACIKKYAAGKWILFKCTIDEKRNKKPKFKGWQDTPYRSKLTVTELGRIFGIVLPAHAVVIDYDPRNDPQAGEPLLNSLTRLLDAYPIDLKKTLVVKSGSGGTHVYLRKPIDILVRSKLAGYPGIDIKSKGGFVVAAGSVHPNGRTYKMDGDPAVIAKCPADLLEVLKWEPPAYDLSQGGVFDNKTTKKEFLRFLRSLESPHDDKFLTACKGYALGLSQKTIFKSMRRFLQYDLGSDEAELLKEKVTHAFTYSRSAQGYQNTAVDFESLDVAKEFGIDVDSDELELPKDEPPKPESKSKSKSKNSKVPKGIEKPPTWILPPESDFDRDAKGNKKKTYLNLVRFFLHEFLRKKRNPLYKLIRYNQVFDKIEFTKRAPWHPIDRPLPEQWKDVDTIKLRGYLEQAHEFQASKENCWDVILDIAEHGAYSPVVQYLYSLTDKWDGSKRLDDFLIKYGGAADTPYVREVTKNMFLSAVARALMPGCQQDHVLILEGAQGLRKTSLFRVLGGPFYVELTISDPTNKDVLSAINGAWFVEISEMGVLTKADIEAFKGFITRCVDRYRPAYAHVTGDFKRRGILVGTSNPNPAGGSYRDETGNRRFWPVEITKEIDTAAVAEIRDQLFAEAMHRFMQGEKYWITDPEIIKAAQAQQEKRQSQDVWLAIIETRMRKKFEDQFDAETGLLKPDSQIFVRVEDVAEAWLGIPKERMQAGAIGRIRACLRKLGFESGTFWYQKERKSIRAWIPLKDGKLYVRDEKDEIEYLDSEVKGTDTIDDFDGVDESEGEPEEDTNVVSIKKAKAKRKQEKEEV